MSKKEESNKKSENEIKEENENSSLILDNDLVIENEYENYAFSDFVNSIESFKPRNIDKFGNTEIKDSIINEANENRIIKTELTQINCQVIIFFKYFFLESFRNY